MCGISGIVGRGAPAAAVKRMVESQRHRGPDDEGTWSNADHGVCLGHNRLSIVDLTAAGHQPMADASGSLVITFNGEVYNFRELRKELPDYHFKTGTDTEVILAAYAAWGPACVERFVGMFAFAIWDERTQTLFAARDRLGIKPFHYAWHEGRFAFASEAKAILAAGLPARPNRHAWAEYLVHGYMDHASETFFEGIVALQPGHFMMLRKGAIETTCYWNLSARAADEIHLTDDEAARHLRGLLGDAVRLRLRSDVPVGVNLSGGLDSAALMAIVDAEWTSGGRVEAFTATYGDPRYDEESHAAAVEPKNQWVHNVVRLTPATAWATAHELMWHEEAPFGGVSTLAYFALHKEALARGVTVLLEGQGMDEMLAGYGYFVDAFLADERVANEAVSADPATLERESRAPQRVHGAVYQDGTQHLRPECVLPEAAALAGPPPQFPAPFRTRLANELHRDLRFTKLPRVLRMNDRLSMAVSRELRVPFLDHRVVEFLTRLPAKQKIRGGLPKFLLRHALEGELPEHVRLAPKRAVVAPQREWLRGDLRPKIEALLDSPSFASRGLVDPAKARSEFARFCAGEGDNSVFVWQWVNMELWFRMFIDKGPREVEPPAPRGA